MTHLPSTAGHLTRLIPLWELSPEVGWSVKRLKAACNHPNKFKRLQTAPREGREHYYTTREWWAAYKNLMR
jgi:hypothetical protein